MDSRYFNMPPFRWYTSSKPRLFTKAVDFSQRMPPVQNIATFGRFPSLPSFCAKLSNQAGNSPKLPRSEEHTSELQSLMRISYAVFCLQKKNKETIVTHKLRLN